MGICTSSGNRENNDITVLQKSTESLKEEIRKLNISPEMFIKQACKSKQQLLEIIGLEQYKARLEHYKFTLERIQQQRVDSSLGLIIIRDLQGNMKEILRFTLKDEELNEIFGTHKFIKESLERFDKTFDQIHQMFMESPSYTLLQQPCQMLSLKEKIIYAFGYFTENFKQLKNKYNYQEAKVNVLSKQFPQGKEEKLQLLQEFQIEAKSQGQPKFDTFQLLQNHQGEVKELTKKILIGQQENQQLLLQQEVEIAALKQTVGKLQGEIDGEKKQQEEAIIQFRQLEAHLNNYKETNKNLGVEKDQLLTKVEILKNEITEVNRVQEMNRSLWQEKIIELQQISNKEIVKRILLEGEIDTQKKTVLRLQGDINKLQDENKKLEMEKKNYQIRVISTKFNYIQLIKVIRKKNQNWKKPQHKILSRIRQPFEELNTKICGMKEEVSKMNNEIQSIVAKNEQTKKRNINLERQVKNAKFEIEQIRQQVRLEYLYNLNQSNDIKLILRPQGTVSLILHFCRVIFRTQKCCFLNISIQENNIYFLNAILYFYCTIYPVVFRHWS